MPFAVPSQRGFTKSGKPSAAAARAASSGDSTEAWGAHGTPAAATTSFAQALSRESESVSASEPRVGTPSISSSDGCPRLAVPAALPLGDVQHRVDAERRAAPGESEERARAAEADRLAVEAPERRLERRDRRLGLVLRVGVRRLSRCAGAARRGARTRGRRGEGATRADATLRRRGPAPGRARGAAMREGVRRWLPVGALDPGHPHSRPGRLLRRRHALAPRPLLRFLGFSPKPSKSLTCLIERART